MTEERLKEIKDSIDFQLSVCDIPEYETSKLLAEEELELYNEVVRLREIIKEAIQYNKEIKDLYKVYETSQERSNAETNLCILEDKETLNILKKNNLTLEQLTGVENE